MKYDEFLTDKLHQGSDSGFAPLFMPDYLFDFQSFMVDYAIRKGRAALLEDCGLGKTVQFLVWAENIVRHTNKPVLVLTPLAVAEQTVREAVKFGIEAVRSNDGKISSPKIYVTNYEKLHFFDWKKFGGIVCDESSCLKSADAARRKSITDFMSKIPYRLLCTATAAPNDYLELGTSSEALGYLGFTDMLNRFFKNDNNNSSLRRRFGEAPKWRFRGHAELPFWRWVCSWARAIRKPSDIGFDDHKFILPELIENNHIVAAGRKNSRGFFKDMPLIAQDLREQREEKRKTLDTRCQLVSELVNTKKPALVWCHLNDEGDLLERLISDAEQISGKDSDDSKEEKLLAFVDGKIRVLITKPKIGAWGLNFQHCSHITTFPSHSFEQKYQGIRRCWRFGQKNPVVVDTVMSKGEERVEQNLKRKELAASAMFENLVAQMNDAIGIEKTNNFKKELETPEWQR